MRLLLVVLVLTSAAHAAAQAAPPASPSDDVEEIVVSITKRDETLKDVAASVTAFSQETIALANLESASDLVTLIPNVVTKGESRTGNFSIRGVSESFSSQSPVAYHVNGLFKLGLDSLLGQYYDLETIELVRGPSGTVYGRNATAGAINFVWRAPHAAYEAFGDALLGNYRHVQLRAVLNAPLLGEGDERLMARLAVQRQVRDGYMNDLERPSRRDDPHNADEWYSRLSLRSRPSDDLELTLHGFYNQSDADPYVSRPLVGDYTTGFLDTRSFAANGALESRNFGVVDFDPYQGYAGFVSDMRAELPFGLGIGACSGGAMPPPPGCNAPAVAIPAGENLLLLIARAYGFPGTRAQRLAQATDLVLFQGEPGLGIPPILSAVAPNAQVGRAAQPIPNNPLHVRSSAWRRNRTSLRVYGADGAARWGFHAGALGELRLDAALGWERGRFNQSVDADGSELPLIDVFRPHRNELWSGELRLSSQGDGAVDWIAGLFWFRNENERSFDEIVLPFGTIVSASSGVAVGFAPFTSISVRPLELLRSSPRVDLELFGGWRWNRDSLALDFENLASPAGPSGPQHGRTVFEEHTWEAGVRWFPSEAHTVYAKFARGYKSGNLEADNQTGVIRGVEPELIRAWEAGVKSSLADGRVQLGLTGFWSDYSDLQVPQTVGLTQFTQNAAAATIRGIELELVARPREQLTLQASAGFLDARFDEFCSDDAAQALAISDPGCPAANPLFPWRGESNLAGHRLEDAPKWKASLFASYQADLGARGTLTPVVKFAYTGGYFLRPYALASDRVGAFTRTDVRLVWQSASERLTLEVFGENLENEIVFARNTTTGEFSGSFPASIGLLPPRTYGVRVGFAWRSE